MTEAARPRSILSALVSTSLNLAWEGVTRPVAKRPDQTPRSAEALSKEWLTYALCRDVPGAQVTDFETGGGSSGTSVRRQINLKYNRAGTDAGLPRTAFAKTTPDLLTRLANGFSGTSVTEAGFYRELRPLLELEAPVGYFSSVDTNSYRSIHVLEDLVATKSATFCSPSTILNREQASEVVQLLAALHSRFHGRSDLKAAYPFLKTYPDWFMDGLKWADLRANHEKAMTKAVEVIPAALTKRRNEVWPALMTAIDMHRSATSTILHSDVHLGNWYMTGDGRMGLCDWQCLNIGHWSRDLAYALSAVLAVKDRRAWESDLIEEYLGLMERGTGQTFDRSEALHAYRLQLFPALLMWTPTLCPPPMLPNMQPEQVSVEMIHRITTAIDDHKALDVALTPAKPAKARAA